MQDSRPSLYAYIITSLCVVVFYILNWDDFIVVVKPVIVPAIFYYYTQTTKYPINILFAIALWLFFIADMVEIVDPTNGIYLIMTCGLLSYLIMFRFALRDKIKLVFSFKSTLVAFLTLIFTTNLCAHVIESTETINTKYFYFFVAYTMIIISMFSYAIIRVFSKNDLVSRLFLAMVVVMFLSDFLYAYNSYIEFHMTLAIISLIAQFISYYWMVEYYNKRQRVAK